MRELYAGQTLVHETQVQFNLRTKQLTLEMLSVFELPFRGRSVREVLGRLNTLSFDIPVFRSAFKAQPSPVITHFSLDLATVYQLVNITSLNSHISV